MHDSRALENRRPPVERIFTDSYGVLCELRYIEKLRDKHPEAEVRSCYTWVGDVTRYEEITPVINDNFMSVYKRIASFISDNKHHLTQDEIESLLRKSFTPLVQEPDSQEINNQLSFPKIAEIKWKDRGSRKSIDPIAFVKATYSQYIDAPGFRAYLRVIDNPLYNALATHVSRLGVPEGMEAFFSRIDPRSVKVDAELRELDLSEPKEVWQKVADGKEAGRLYEAARRRER